MVAGVEHSVFGARSTSLDKKLLSVTCQQGQMLRRHPVRKPDVLLLGTFRRVCVNRTLSGVSVLRHHFKRNDKVKDGEWCHPSLTSTRVTLSVLSRPRTPQSFSVAPLIFKFTNLSSADVIGQHSFVGTFLVNALSRVSCVERFAHEKYLNGTHYTWFFRIRSERPLVYHAPIMHSIPKN